ncbi:MAG: hypothetical protein FD177_2404 [Desulfovibrionaceae bacterium]|nr:MAG: hypothetical protein FD177_2404 [Desulfovibrionaceae bacterium]
MPIAFRHGVYSQQLPTHLIPVRRVDSALPVVFGTAPVDRLAAGERPVNSLTMCSSFDEFVKLFGYDEDYSKYTLCEFAYVYLSLYSMAPVIFVNVYDPAEHRSTVAAQAKAFDAKGRIALGLYDIQDLAVKNADGSQTFAAGTDYTLDPALGVIVRKTTGTIPALGAVKLDYSHGDPTKVVSADIVGGVEPVTGAKSGLELVNQVFPKFGMLPGQLVAPGFSQDPAVAIVIESKAVMINGHFRCICWIDAPESLGVYSAVPEYKTQNNLTTELMNLCWPRLTLGGKTHWMSSHAAALTAEVDWGNESIPYESPSNKRLRCEGMVVDGQEVLMGLDEANYLNSMGIVTAVNFMGGLRLWGNRTCAYPDNTDVKDSFIAIQRMFNWVGNTLILTWWHKVDSPIRRRRLIDSIVDSNNVWFNGLAAREFILGGRVTFQQGENPVTDLMDGKLRFHVFFTPPSPAEDVTFLLEYDPDYVTALYGA